MIVGLIRRIQRLSTRKIVWSRPRRQPVLLIDPSGVDILTQFIAIEDIEILGNHKLFAQRLAQIVIIIDQQDHGCGHHCRLGPRKGACSSVDQEEGPL